METKLTINTSTAIKLLEMVGATEESAHVVEAIKMACAALKTVEGQKSPTNSGLMQLLSDLKGDYEIAASVGNESAKEIVQRINAVLAQQH